MNSNLFIWKWLFTDDGRSFDGCDVSVVWYIHMRERWYDGFVMDATEAVIEDF